MTYREKFFQEHSDWTGAETITSCPFHYGYEATAECPRYPYSGLTMNCKDCWNRRIGE